MVYIIGWYRLERVLNKDLHNPALDYGLILPVLPATSTLLTTLILYKEDHLAVCTFICMCPLLVHCKGIA